jgi:biotin carboxylase
MQHPDGVVQVGFPIMIKATAGGGGRGMRLAMKEEEFLTLMRQASQEAEAAFGNGAVYLERYVQNPRHIEFQVRMTEDTAVLSCRYAQMATRTYWVLGLRQWQDMCTAVSASLMRCCM